MPQGGGRRVRRADVRAGAGGPRNPAGQPLLSLALTSMMDAVGAHSGAVYLRLGDEPVREMVVMAGSVRGLSALRSGGFGCLRHRQLVIRQADEGMPAPLRGKEAVDSELAELYARHHGAVRAYARSRCRDPHQVDVSATIASLIP
ncbi:hypothetical protein ACFV2U_45290 [Streptomyces sp. NPDC059697]|uniref:hypothetical protein n=1 Tax=Streptomyces sp. NPDC059697 TaxID=3346912 RepID=UPI0036CE6F2A